jgi:deoxyribose-phosphate aldolase
VIFDENLPDSYVASLIDHTLLKPEATEEEIANICSEARQFDFASVCVNPFWVPFAVGAVEGAVKVCTTIGFPLGANEGRIKIAEAELALSRRAAELDMVLNIGALRSCEYHIVSKEIAEVADIVHSGGAILKVILETCLLTNAEKLTACRLAAESGADFVKTSTGFSKGGATVEDVRLMRKAVGENLGVKASGGIRSLDALRQVVAAGANRIGTSSGVQIMNEVQGEPERKPPLPLSGAKVPGGKPEGY